MLASETQHEFLARLRRERAETAAQILAIRCELMEQYERTRARLLDSRRLLAQVNAVLEGRRSP